MTSSKRPKMETAGSARAPRRLRKKSGAQPKPAPNELVGALSHSLRNPLGVVLFTTTLLERELAGQPEKKRYVDALKRAAREMTGVIDDFVDCAELEAGTLVLAEELLRPEMVVQHVAEQAEQTLSGRPLKVVSAIGTNLHAVRADQTRLVQALKRVVEDAARFLPEGGTLTIGAENTAEGVRLFVSDTGTALSPSDRALVFLRQAPKDRRVCRGTGVGMFVAKGIIEASGGRAELVDTKGVGNTIAITLPKASATLKRPKRS